MAPRIVYTDGRRPTPRFFRRLWIYDATDDVCSDMVYANDRPDTCVLPIKGTSGPNGKGAVPVMADLFDMLVRDGVTFQNAVFAFHGKPGTLRANGDDFGARQWRLYFAGHGHERLFPSPLSKIYFPGCDVAAGEEGWKFLEAAGSVLLRGLGGLSYGWTSLGFAMPSHWRLIGGHAVHLWGTTRYVAVAPGGGRLVRIDTARGDTARPDVDPADALRQDPPERLMPSPAQESPA